MQTVPGELSSFLPPRFPGGGTLGGSAGTSAREETPEDDQRAARRPTEAAALVSQAWPRCIKYCQKAILLLNVSCAKTFGLGAGRVAKGDALRVLDLQAPVGNV